MYATSDSTEGNNNRIHTVMLVDDEKWSLKALRHTLERTGLPFKVTAECANGLEAFQQFRAEPADLVLTDVRMPVMDGLSLAHELHELYDDPSIIIVSGFDDFQYAQQAIRCGVADYLLKPVELEALTRSLERWLSRIASPKTDPTLPDHPSEASTIERVIHYIHHHLPHDVTLNEAARHVHLHPNYLSQLFKQKIGRNFLDYVVECRMEEAKRLLASTSLRVSEVADRLGYSDIAHFSKSFKKHYGATPSEFRKRSAEP